MINFNLCYNLVYKNKLQIYCLDFLVKVPFIIVVTNYSYLWNKSCKQVNDELDMLTRRIYITLNSIFNLSSEKIWSLKKFVLVKILISKVASRQYGAVSSKIWSTKKNKNKKKWKFRKKALSLLHIALSLLHIACSLLHIACSLLQIACWLWS